MSETDQQQNSKGRHQLWQVIGVLVIVVLGLIGVVWGLIKSDLANVRVDVSRLQANKTESWTVKDHRKYDDELDEWRLKVERRLTRLEAQREDQ